MRRRSASSHWGSRDTNNPVPQRMKQQVPSRIFLCMERAQSENSDCARTLENPQLDKHVGARRGCALWATTFFTVTTKRSSRSLASTMSMNCLNGAHSHSGKAPLPLLLLPRPCTWPQRLGERFHPWRRSTTRRYHDKCSSVLWRNLSQREWVGASVPSACRLVCIVQEWRVHADSQDGLETKRNTSPPSVSPSRDSWTFRGVHHVWHDALPKLLPENNKRRKSSGRTSIAKYSNRRKKPSAPTAHHVSHDKPWPLDDAGVLSPSVHACTMERLQQQNQKWSWPRKTQNDQPKSVKLTADTVFTTLLSSNHIHSTHHDHRTARLHSMFPRRLAAKLPLMTALVSFPPFTATDPER